MRTFIEYIKSRSVVNEGWFTRKSVVQQPQQLGIQKTPKDIEYEREEHGVGEVIGFIQEGRHRGEIVKKYPIVAKLAQYISKLNYQMAMERQAKTDSMYGDGSDHSEYINLVKDFIKNNYRELKPAFQEIGLNVALEYFGESRVNESWFGMGKKDNIPPQLKKLNVTPQEINTLTQHFNIPVDNTTQWFEVAPWIINIRYDKKVPESEESRWLGPSAKFLMFVKDNFGVNSFDDLNQKMNQELYYIGDKFNIRRAMKQRDIVTKFLQS